MWLENLEVRVKKYPKGWVVETKKPYWNIFGIKYKWIHIISVSGMKDEPWYYKDRDMAVKQAAKYLEWDLLINSKL